MTQAQAPVVVGARVAARPRTKGARFGNPLLHLVLIGLVVIWALPAIGLLISSFRSSAAISQSGWWTALFNPAQFNLDNYRNVLGQSGVGEAFINSFIITLPATVIVVVIAAFAAYAFSWMEFRGRDLLFVIIVGLLVIPLQVTLIPVLRLFTTLNTAFGLEIGGTFVAVWLAHTGYGLPFAVYLLRNYFGGLPKEVFESAAIDGASPTTAFFRLALPMSVPVLASLVIFQFLWVWNDLLVALVYLGPQPALLPLSVTLANLTTSRGAGFELLTAAAFISMVIPITVFLGLQRYFVRGITGGAVKG
jgi:alpha-glucoside transport system permease protein